MFLYLMFPIVSVVYMYPGHEIPSEWCDLVTVVYLTDLSSDVQ